MPASKMNMPIRGGGKPKWKNQSEQFRQAMRAARGGGNGGGKSGGKFGDNGYDPGYQEDQYDDRTPCPYCGRKFNDIAAQRHIPHCQNKAKEQAMRVGPPRGGKGGYRR